MATTIIRINRVLELTGRSRSSHYSDVQEELFTEPVAIGRRAVGWPAHEVEILNKARIAGKSDDEIRLLVRQLMAERVNCLDVEGY